MNDARDVLYAAQERKSQETKFLVAVIAIAVFAFLAVWKGPDLIQRLPGLGHQWTLTKLDRGHLKATIDHGDTHKLVDLLAKLDPSGYEEFAVVMRTHPPEGEFQLALNAWMGKLMLSEAHLAAKIPPQNVDRIFDKIRRSVRDLEQAKSPFCRGETWGKLQAMGQTQAGATLLTMVGDVGPGSDIYDFGVDLSLIYVEGLLAAKDNPVAYGPLNSDDKKAMTRMLRQVAFSPEIMGSAIGAARSRAPERAMTAVDICMVGRVVLEKFDRLPADTKGRVWAAAFSGGLDSVGLPGL